MDATRSPLIRSPFARGVLLTIGTNVAQLFVGVATSVLTARVLGPADLGRYSLAVLYSVIIVTFVNLGLSPATTYYVSRRSHPTGEIVSSSILASFVLGVVGVVGGGAVALFWGDRVLRGVPPVVAFLALLTVPATLAAGNLRAVLNGEQRFRSFNLSIVAEAVLRLALMAAVWFTSRPLLAAVGANVLATVVIALTLAALIVRRVGWGKLSLPYLRGSFAYGSKAYVGNAIQFLNYRVDMLLLNAFSGPAAVGLYAVGVLFAERLRIVSGAASTVLFPRVAAAHAAGNGAHETAAVCRVVLWSTALTAIGFWAFSHWLVLLLYSRTYAAAVAPLQILLLGIVVQSGAEVVAHDFAGRGMPLVNTTIAGLTLVLNVVLLLLLVPPFGAVGAAWASSLSYAAQGVATFGWYAHVSGETLREMLLPQRADLSRMWRMISRPAAPAAAED